MAQTVAHLVDHVIPPVPVRQWVISLPKRLRGVLGDWPKAVAAVTRIFLAEIEKLLCLERLRCDEQATPPSPRPRVGAVSFLHRFGSGLNRHAHLHAAVTDGVFLPGPHGPDGLPAFLPARPLTQGDLAALTERVRRRVIAFFKRQGFLNAHAAAAMLAWENSGFSIDASVRITLFRPHLRVSCQPLEHLLRYCARPPFALERLSVIRDEDGRATKVRYVMPRHKAANWVGPGRGRKSTPPRKHRHRYHGVFAPNHPLRPAVTALAVANVGKQRDAATGGHGGDGHGTEGCCDANHATLKPRSHDTSRIAGAKLMARVGEKFPLECPACGGDIRLRGDCRQEPAHFEVRGSQAEEGQDGFARVKSATDTSRRTARTAADLPLAGRPPTGASSCRCTTTATSFNRRIEELPAIDIHSL